MRRMFERQDIWCNGKVTGKIGEGKNEKEQEWKCIVNAYCRREIQKVYFSNQSI